MQLQWVQNWGGFEEFVADLHKSGSVKVEHDVTLMGKSGATRQIDVLLTHKVGLYETKILIECKHWKRQVERQHIDVLASSMEDLNAAKGVFFTINGFQDGAETYAKHKGIELFKVRDLTDEEWGAPGRIIDFFMQFYARTIGNVGFRATGIAIDEIDPDKLESSHEIKLGWPEHGTRTPTVLRDGNPGQTIEEIVDELSIQSMRRIGDTVELVDEGADATKYMYARVEVPFKPSLLFIQKGVLVKVDAISFDLGVQLDQKRFHMDRGQDLAYACIVENCITGVLYTAMKSKAESAEAELTERQATPAVDKGEVFQNGSILKIYLQPYFPFEEIMKRLGHLVALETMKFGFERTVERMIDATTAEAKPTPESSDVATEPLDPHQP